MEHVVTMGVRELRRTASEVRRPRYSRSVPLSPWDDSRLGRARRLTRIKPRPLRGHSIRSSQASGRSRRRSCCGRAGQHIECCWIRGLLLSGLSRQEVASHALAGPRGEAAVATTCFTDLHSTSSRTSANASAPKNPRAATIRSPSWSRS